MNLRIHGINTSSTHQGLSQLPGKKCPLSVVVWRIQGRNQWEEQDAAGRRTSRGLH